MSQAGSTSGGGGGGASPLTTKGDVYTYSTSDARLAIGTDEHCLIADSAQATGNKWGILQEAGGGTGQSTYATGDIIYASGANTLSKLAAGTNGHVLTLSGGVPVWQVNAAGGDVTGPASSTDNALARFDSTTGKIIQNSNATLSDAGSLSLAVALPESSGGTNQTTYTTGDILYASAANTLSKLAVGSQSDRLITTSSGVPAWLSSTDYVYWNDDFLIGISPWETQTAGGGSGVTQGVSTAGHPGVALMTVSSNGECTMRALERESSILFGGGFIRWEAILRIPTLSNATDRFDIDAGFGDQFRGTGMTDGIFFRYSDNLNSGQWVGTTESGGTQTDVNSSITVSAGQWYKLAIEVNAAATSVEFFVDGVSIGTSSTNIPTSACIHFGMDASVGTGTETMEIDYVSFYQELTTSRG